MHPRDYLFAAETTAEALGVRIITALPRAGHWAHYEHARRTITLHPGLSALQRDWALWHELGHAAHGHTTSSPHNEREADTWAVQHMFRLEDLRAAIRPGLTAQEIAVNLGVYPAAVDALMAAHRRSLGLAS